MAMPRQQNSPLSMFPHPAGRPLALVGKCCLELVHLRRARRWQWLAIGMSLAKLLFDLLRILAFGFIAFVIGRGLAFGLLCLLL